MRKIFSSRFPLLNTSSIVFLGYSQAKVFSDVRYAHADLSRFMSQNRKFTHFVLRKLGTLQALSLSHFKRLSSLVYPQNIGLEFQKQT